MVSKERKSSPEQAAAHSPISPGSLSVGNGGVSPEIVQRGMQGQLRPGDLTALQRTVGNQAVNRALAARVQPKLTVGAAHDPYEQEADQVAQQVLSMPDQVSQSKPSGQGEIQARPAAMRVTPVQRKARIDPRGSFEAGAQVEASLAANKGGGSPLPDETRSYMEPRFGADFSGVRVHTGSEAVGLNRELSAKAFTHGNDIYLGGGQSVGDKALLAHELTHTIQQGAAVQRQAGGENTRVKAAPKIQALHRCLVQRVYDREKVPPELKERLILTPESLEAWEKSGDESRRFDTFIGVTSVTTGRSEMYPCFSVLHNPDKLDKDKAGDRVTAPEHVDTLLKGRKNYASLSEAEIKRVYGERALINPEEVVGAVDGYFHGKACQHSQIPDGEALGWSIKGNKCVGGKMRFISSRNNLKFPKHPVDDSGRPVLKWGKFEGQDMKEVKSTLQNHQLLRESRDMPEVWAQAVSDMVARDLGLKREDSMEWGCRVGDHGEYKMSQFHRITPGDESKSTKARKDWEKRWAKREKKMIKKQGTQQRDLDPLPNRAEIIPGANAAAPGGNAASAAALAPRSRCEELRETKGEIFDFIAELTPRLKSTPSSPEDAGLIASTSTFCQTLKMLLVTNVNLPTLPQDQRAALLHGTIAERRALSKACREKGDVWGQKPLGQLLLETLDKLRHLTRELTR